MCHLSPFRHCHVECVIPAHSIIAMKIRNVHTSYVAFTRLFVIPAKAGIYAVVGLLLLIASACTGPAVPAHPEYGVVVVTQDLAQGSNRVIFGLVDVEGMPVRSDQAQVQTVFLPPGDAPGEPRGSAAAGFIQWPTGPQGVFAATIDFDEPGFWRLEVTTTTADGKAVEAQGAVQVKDKTATPALGDPAPRSVTPTAGEVEDLGTITSATIPDPDLYRLSVHQALDEGKPLVVVFATPAFCVSATCGPQVEVLSQVKDKFPSEANFIHVEVFKDPHLIEGNRAEAETVPAVEEWNLPTEPWTFVIDKDGMVRAKFEQFTSADIIEEALREVL